MEIKTCEEYVLEELRKTQEELEKLKECIEVVTRDWVVDDDCVLHIHKDIDMSYTDRKTLDNFIYDKYKSVIECNTTLSTEVETKALSNWKRNII